MSSPKTKVSTRRRITIVAITQKLKELEARRQANIVANRAAGLDAIFTPAMEQFGRNYVSGMVGFNALPGVVTALTNRPLQAMVDSGSPGLQKLILQTLGPKLGAGAARYADTALMGGTGKIPGLNLGAGYMFEKAPSGAVNIPENRPQWPSRTGGQPSGFQSQSRGWK